MIKALGDLMTVLSEADPADKAEVYGQLGLTLTYDPAARRVKAEARPESIMYIGTCPRGTRNLRTCPLSFVTIEFALSAGCER